MRHLLLKVLAAVALTGLVTLSAVAVYVARTWNRTYDAPLPDLHASSDPSVIARGEYLAYGPSHCVECHATTEEAAAADAAHRKPRLMGGRRFDAPPLGAIYSRNLTPDPDTGIGRYSDPQLARMLRYSLRPDGHASVQLLMPFGGMSDEDLVAIISFLRSQAPVHHDIAANQWSIAGKIIKSFSPAFKPREHVEPPPVSPRGPTRERGEYLARNVGNCVSCHTRFNPVTFAKVAPEFAGGNEMEPDTKGGVDRAIWFRTPNLTPEVGSALNKFPDRDTFIARFQRGGRHYEGSPMPWESYGRMNSEDLAALYEFFRSLRPQHGPSGDPQFRKKVG